MAGVKFRRGNWGFCAAPMLEEDQGYCVGFYWGWQDENDAEPGHFRRSLRLRLYSPVRYIRWQWPVRLSVW